MRFSPYISVVVNIKGGGSGMKVEVMVDKDNTHFSYKFDNIDKVIDGSNESGSIENKLVLLRKIKDKLKDKQGYETIAVFNIWSFWKQIDEDKVVAKFRTAYGNIPITKETLNENPDLVKSIDFTDLSRIEPRYKDTKYR